jgi:ABC-2 family transporter
VLRHNRLTLAIMLGSPALVVSMFAVLFEPHAFAAQRPSASAAVSITYWMAFAAFFFGLTYGLLQVVTEAAVLRRERFVGLRIGPYLAGKAAVLVPVLVAVNVAMVAVLRATNRLPAGGVRMYASLLATLMLDAVAALALGLLASAAVADPAQATLALPMLCFPAVLFSGAVLPVPTMAFAGRLISAVTSDRWAFESTGRALGLDRLLAHDPSGRGLELLAEQKDAFAAPQLGHWAILVAFTVVFLVGAARVIRRRTAST